MSTEPKSQQTQKQNFNLDIPGVVIQSLLGQGGMGQVYQGYQEFLHRHVAIKTLPKSNVDKEFTQRFQREAKILAQLSHPNIISCFDAGVNGETFYLIMELIKGSDLNDYVSQKGALPREIALKITLDLAKALAYAHSKGILHRDVKLENILLQKNNELDPAFPYEVKLADLGLSSESSELNSDTALTMPGHFWGTPAIMAPEQFFSETAIDHRVDIYSLGCLLFHLLTGQAAFHETTMTKIIAKKSMPEHFSSLIQSQQIPADIAALIEDMTKPNVDERLDDYTAIIERCEELTTLDEKEKKKNPAKIIFLSAAIFIIVTTISFLLAPAKEVQKTVTKLTEPKASQLPPALPPAVELVKSQEKQAVVNKATDEAIEKKTPVTTEKKQAQAVTSKNIHIEKGEPATIEVPPIKLKPIVFSDNITTMIKPSFAERLQSWENPKRHPWVPEEEADGIIGYSPKKEIVLNYPLEQKFARISGDLFMRSSRESRISLHLEEQHSASIDIKDLSLFYLVNIVVDGKVVSSMRFNNSELKQMKSNGDSSDAHLRCQITAAEEIEFEINEKKFKHRLNKRYKATQLQLSINKGVSAFRNFKLNYAE